MRVVNQHRLNQTPPHVIAFTMVLLFLRRASHGIKIALIGNR